MAVMVEMIVYRGVDGGEFLEGLHIPKLCHRLVSSSERLV